MRAKVLSISTSRRTRGGITSVVKNYENSWLWSKWNMVWIETHIDGNNAKKAFFFLKGFLKFLIEIPTSSHTHIHVSEPVSAIRKIPFVLIAKLFNKKIIIHFHSFSTATTIESKFSPLYKTLFDRADIVITLSGTWQKSIKSKWPSLTPKLRILFNPCETREKSAVQKENTILYAGTINERKGYFDLIKAFSLIKDKYINWRLVFAGNGEIEKAKVLATELEVLSQIDFLGWVSSEQKASTFQKASIFCLPSYAEGFPMAVLDAVSYELPVITTDVGGICDVMEHNTDALIFLPGDVKALSEHLSTLISDKALRDKLSIRSLHLASTTFSKEKIINELDEIYLGLKV